MEKVLVISFLLCSIGNVFSQNCGDGGRALMNAPLTSEPVEDGEDNAIYVRPEEKAYFTAGNDSLCRFIAANLVYPRTCEVFQGKAHVQFTVNKDGSLADVFLQESIGPNLEQEVVRVIRLMGKGKMWTPGRSNGKVVRSKFILPIEFKTAEVLKGQ